ncbi:hypothetical protein PVAP13_5NG477005 [Panicum virgatum]|uniref:Uncharacterized protein n=1 Tax=Panicum virgatum TaxID=38727 RepID=A0A8T0RWG0_PANVG|nr:hypothetical protein PVAP13_5NG477005 [Panicum virgatum]
MNAHSHPCNANERRKRSAPATNKSPVGKGLLMPSPSSVTEKPSDAPKTKQQRKRCPALTRRSRKTNLATPATLMLERLGSAEQPATQASTKATDRRRNKSFTPPPSPPVGKNPTTPWRTSMGVLFST